MSYTIQKTYAKTWHSLTRILSRFCDCIYFKERKLSNVKESNLLHIWMFWYVWYVWSPDFLIVHSIIFSTNSFGKES